VSKSIKYLGLTRVANSYVDRLDKFEKLKEVANRKNYPYKVKLLHKKISEEFDFWDQKKNSSEKKLEDLKKDLIFIESQINISDFNKERIDLLMSKYGFN
jgi:hypothetical protein